jgi:hypothetical protein
VVFQRDSAAGQGLRVGDCFLNQNPGSPEHLWIVVAGPTPAGELAIFNITSWREGCDESCIVERGEHPFVQHKSVVAYARGQLLSDETWALLQRHGCTMKPPVSAELLRKIQDGALASDFTPGKLQTLVRQELSLI